MAETKYMVIDKVEELLDDAQKVIGRLVTDKAGEELKVKKGQGGKLTDRWRELDDGIGKAFEFTMGQFKPPGKTESYPFVSDFKEVKEIFVEQAIQKVANAQVDSKTQSIERQVSLKCATDVGVALINKTGGTMNILNQADEFYNWLQGKEAQGETETSTTSKSKGVEETPKPEDSPKEKPAKIRPDQIETLQEFKKRGISLKPFIEKFGWGITRIIDLREAQAETLIKAIKQKGE